MTKQSNALERIRAVRMLALASLYWGLSFPLIKAITLLIPVLVPGAGSWFIAALAVAPRYLLAALFTLPLWRREAGAVTGSELRQGLGVGAFSTLGALLQTDALQFTEASTSAFLTQFSAILVPAWIALRHRRNPGPVVWGCCSLVLLGVAVLGHFDWRALRFGRGEWETLLCSVFYTGQILWVGKKEFRGNRPERVTHIIFALQAVAFATLAAATAPRFGSLVTPWLSPPWLGLTLALTLVCTVGAFSIMNRWQPRITSTEAGLIYCTEPVFATVFTLFVPAILAVLAGVGYPNERASWSLVAGGGLITLANVLIQIKASGLEDRLGEPGSVSRPE